MRLNLSGCEAVRPKLKNGLKTQKMHFLPVLELMLDSLCNIIFVIECIFVGVGHFRLTSFIIYVGYFLSVDFKWIMQYDFLMFLLPHFPLASKV